MKYILKFPTYVSSNQKHVNVLEEATVILVCVGLLLLTCGVSSSCEGRACVARPSTVHTGHSDGVLGEWLQVHELYRLHFR